MAASEAVHTPASTIMGDFGDGVAKEGGWRVLNAKARADGSG